MEYYEDVQTTSERTFPQHPMFTEFEYIDEDHRIIHRRALWKHQLQPKFVIVFVQ